MVIERKKDRIALGSDHGNAVFNRRRLKLLAVDNNKLSDALKLHRNPLISSILWNRGIRTPQELEYRLEKLLPADNFKQLHEALRLLNLAVRQQLRVVVVGDFDSDGMTATALAVLALQDLGFERVDYFIPNRFEHGYGLTPKAVELVLARFAPELIITVDNGIVNYEGVQLAKAAGVQVLITDHHLANPELPAADAIINPNQMGDCFGSKHLAGVGVILYLMLALRRELRASGWFEERGIKEPNLAQYLDLVAIGTMADAAVLDFNNRILVHEGVKRIRSGKTRLGILAILEIAKRDYRQLCSEDLVFVIAPRLNAAGRLSDAELVVKLLTTINRPRAQALASQLEQLNAERKQIGKDMEQQAVELVQELQRMAGASNTETSGASASRQLSALVLYREYWHQGINGIVASRIKERFALPTIVFANGKDGGLKGSARSVEGFDIRASFAQLAQEEPELISYFGGHAMAAGISVKPNKLARFTEAWGRLVQRTLPVTSDGCTSTLEVDDYLDARYLTLETAQAIRELGPWGNGFLEPMFYGCFLVESADLIGANHLRLRLRLLDRRNAQGETACLAVPGEQEDVAIGGQRDELINNVWLFDAVLFNSTREQRMILAPANYAQVVFKLAVNGYGGYDRLQLMILEVKIDG